MAERRDRITECNPGLSEYKGNPVLTLNPQGRQSLAFGLGKGMIIAENLAALAAFLVSHGKSAAATPEQIAAAETFLRSVGYHSPKQGV